MVVIPPCCQLLLPMLACMQLVAIGSGIGERGSEPGSYPSLSPIPSTRRVHDWPKGFTPFLTSY